MVSYTTPSQGVRNYLIPLCNVENTDTTSDLGIPEVTSDVEIIYTRQRGW